MIREKEIKRENKRERELLRDVKEMKQEAVKRPAIRCHWPFVSVSMRAD